MIGRVPYHGRYDITKESKELCQRIKEVLRYDKEEGKLYWTDFAYSTVRGKEAGKGTTPGKHSTLCLDGVRYATHRVVWLLEYGEFPIYLIDHIDRDPTNNKLENLRIGDYQLNQRNRKLNSNNTSGHKGVRMIKKSGKFHATIGIGKGEVENLGYFRTIEEAIAARKLAEEKYGYTI